MTYLSFASKIKLFYNTLMDYRVALIFIFVLFIFSIFKITKLINKKDYILLIVLTNLMVFGYCIYTNYNELINTFDNFSTLFFKNIYFPSIYVYIVTLIITLVSFIASLININMKKIYKIINGIVFMINNLLLFLVLNLIAKNNIDIFSIDSLYTNNKLVNILELSMDLMIIWIILLITVSVSNCLYDRFSKKDNIVLVDDSVSNEIEIESIDDEVIVSNDYKYPNIMIEEINDNQLFENILTGDINKFNNKEVIQDNDNISDLKLENKFNNNIETIPVLELADNKNNFTYIFTDNSEEIFEPIVEEKKLFNVLDLSLDNLIYDAPKTRFNHRTTINDMANEVSKIEYSLADYKKIINMLNDLKNNSNKNIISVEDAVATCLMNNYSIDDCVRFKNILKNSLNID